MNKAELLSQLTDSFPNESKGYAFFLLRLLVNSDLAVSSDQLIGVTQVFHAIFEAEPGPLPDTNRVALAIVPLAILINTCR